MECTKCHKVLPATEEYFYKQKYKKDGEECYKLAFPCKECRKKHQLNYINKDGYKEKQKIYHASWSIRNRDREAVNKRRLRSERPEHYKAYYKEYQQKNMDKFVQYAKERNLEKKFIINNQEWKACLNYFDNSCAYCGLTNEEHKLKHRTRLHKEHVIVLGRNNLTNCVPACKECNSQKSRYSLNTWYNVENPVYSRERYLKICHWINTDSRKTLQTLRGKNK